MHGERERANDVDNKELHFMLVMYVQFRNNYTVITPKQLRECYALAILPLLNSRANEVSYKKWEGETETSVSTQGFFLCLLQCVNIFCGPKREQCKLQHTSPV